MASYEIHTLACTAMNKQKHFRQKPLNLAIENRSYYYFLPIKLKASILVVFLSFCFQIQSLYYIPKNRIVLEKRISSFFFRFSTFPRIETFPNRMKAGISFHLCMQILESPLYLSSDFAKRLGGCSKLQIICICTREGHKTVWWKSVWVWWNLSKGRIFMSVDDSQTFFELDMWIWVITSSIQIIQSIKPTNL